MFIPSDASGSVDGYPEWLSEVLVDRPVQVDYTLRVVRDAGPPAELARPVDVTHTALAASRFAGRRRAQPNGLAKPAVVTAATGALGGTGIQLVLQIRRRRVANSSFLRPPIIGGAVFTAIPIRVELAVSSRKARATHPNLHRPVVVDGSIAFHGPRVRLVDPTSPRRIPRVKSRLRPPILPSTVFIAAPVGIYLAASTKIPRRAKKSLPQFVPINPSIAFHGPGVRLAEALSASGLRRRRARSVLFPPSGGAGIAFFGPGVIRPRVTNVSTLIRRRPEYFLRRPVVVGTAGAFAPVKVKLAYSKRGKAKPRLPEVIYEARIYPSVEGYLTRVRDRVPPTRSFLRKPAVVSFFFARVDVTLVRPRDRIRPTKSFLRKPTAVRFFLARVDVSLVRPRDKNPPVHAFLRPMGPDPLVYEPIAGYLVRPLDRVPATTSLLRPPAVLVAAAIYYGPKVTRARIRPPRTHPFLRAPVLVFAATPYLRPISTHLAPSSRGVPRPQLSPPVVVALVLARPIKVELAASRRPVAKSKLPKVIVDASVYKPIRGTLTKPLDRVPATLSFLRPPAVLVAAAVYHGPKVTLVRIKPVAVHSVLRRPTDLVDAADLGYVRVYLSYSRRGAPQSILRDPVVVAPVLARAIYVNLAPSSRGIPRSILRDPAVVAPVLARAIETTLVRIRPARTLAILRRPVDLVDQQDVGYLRTHLAYSRRGRPLSQLSPPAVVAPVLARRTDITLAPQRRGVSKWFLRAPVVVFAATPYLRPVDVTLAYSLRGKPKSKLSFTTVYAAPVFYARPISVHLAYSLRGRPVSLLSPPTVVNSAVELSGPETTLAKIRPFKTLAILRRPVVVVASTNARPISVHLAYSVRGKPLSGLGGPIVLDQNTAYPQGPMVQLAPQRRGVPKSRLRQPVVVFAFSAQPIRVELARIRPVRTTSLLRRPVDLVDRDDLGFVRVHLAYSLRGKPKSKLRPQGVVFPFFARAVDVTLIRIRPRPTRWLLRKPTDLVDQADVGYVRVHLAYSLRGKPKSKLRGPIVVGPILARPIEVQFVRIKPQPVHSILRDPAVIDVRPQTYYISTWLTYSLRGKPKSYLRPDSKFAPQPSARYTILVHLAYQSRGKPKSKLRPPVVINAATPYFRREPVTLAYSSRGRPKSKIRGPIVVNVFTARAIRVELAPSRFPRPKSRLLPVPAAFRPVGQLVVTLAYSRRGTPKSRLYPPTDLVDRIDLGYVRTHLAYSVRGEPKSRLSPPTVVARFVATPAKINLAPSSRGVPKSRLPLVIYGARVYAPITVDLAPSTRLARSPHSKLIPPALVASFIASPIRVTLAKTPPKSTISFLRPPTAIKYEYYFGPETTLTRIRPPKTRPFLRAPVVVFPPPPPAIEARVEVHLAYSVRGKPRYRLHFTPGPGVPGVICGEGVLDLSEVCGVVLTDSSAILPGGVLDTDTVSGGDATGAAVIMGEDLAEYRVDQEIE